MRQILPHFLLLLVCSFSCILSGSATPEANLNSPEPTQPEYRCNDLASVPTDEVCSFICDHCPSDSRIQYSLIYYCYVLPKGQHAAITFLVVLLLVVLPLLVCLLNDTAELWFAPTMSAISQCTPFMSPRFAGVTLVAIGNGAPDLSSNITALQTGQWSLSSGALTGAAMFVQCIVASEVIRIAGGVECNMAMMRDVLVYAISISGIAAFFAYGTITMYFVYFSLGVYLIYAVWVFMDVDTIIPTKMGTKKKFVWSKLRDSLLRLQWNQQHVMSESDGSVRDVLLEHDFLHETTSPVPQQSPRLLGDSMLGKAIGGGQANEGGIAGQRGMLGQANGGGQANKGGTANGVLAQDVLHETSSLVPQLSSRITLEDGMLAEDNNKEEGEDGGGGDEGGGEEGGGGGGYLEMPGKLTRPPDLILSDWQSGREGEGDFSDMPTPRLSPPTTATHPSLPETWKGMLAQVYGGGQANEGGIAGQRGERRAPPQSPWILGSVLPQPEAQFSPSQIAPPQYQAQYAPPQSAPPHSQAHRSSSPHFQGTHASALPRDRRSASPTQQRMIHGSSSPTQPRLTRRASADPYSSRFSALRPVNQWEGPQGLGHRQSRPGGPVSRALPPQDPAHSQEGYQQLRPRLSLGDSYTSMPDSSASTRRPLTVRPSKILDSKTYRLAVFADTVKCGLEVASVDPSNASCDESTSPGPSMLGPNHGGRDEEEGHYLPRSTRRSRYSRSDQGHGQHRPHRNFFGHANHQETLSLLPFLHTDHPQGGVEARRAHTIGVWQQGVQDEQIPLVNNHHASLPRRSVTLYPDSLESYRSHPPQPVRYTNTHQQRQHPHAHTHHQQQNLHPHQHYLGRLLPHPTIQSIPSGSSLSSMLVPGAPLELVVEERGPYSRSSSFVTAVNTQSPLLDSSSTSTSFLTAADTQTPLLDSPSLSTSFLTAANTQSPMIDCPSISSIPLSNDQHGELSRAASAPGSGSIKLWNFVRSSEMVLEDRTEGGQTEGQRVGEVNVGLGGQRGADSMDLEKQVIENLQQQSNRQQQEQQQKQKQQQQQASFQPHLLVGSRQDGPDAVTSTVNPFAFQMPTGSHPASLSHHDHDHTDGDAGGGGGDDAALRPSASDYYNAAVAAASDAADSVAGLPSVSSPLLSSADWASPPSAKDSMVGGWTRDGLSHSPGAGPLVEYLGERGAHTHVGSTYTASLCDDISTGLTKEKNTLFQAMVQDVSMGACEDWEELPTPMLILRIVSFPVLFPFYLALRASIPFVDPKGYNRSWLLVSMLLAPSTMCMYLSAVSWQVYLAAACIGAGLCLGVWLATRGSEKHVLPALSCGKESLYDFGPPFFSALGFVVGMMWIDIFATEAVGIISLCASVMRVRPSFMGLTLMAWGNSLGDLAGNAALAKKGFSGMALTACFASPLFNMLISFACGACSYFTRSGQSSLPITLSAPVALGCGFLLVYCLVIVVVGITNNFFIPKNFYIFARCWYGLYLVLAVYLGFANIV